jgi:uncharacterized membrane protein (UPF0182 family)
MTNFEQSAPLGLNRKRTRFGCVFLLFVFAVIFLMAALNPYAEYLWYKEDARHPQVFSLMYETRGTLFIVGLAVSLLTLYSSLSRAISLSMVFLERPASVGEVILTRILTNVQHLGPVLIKVGSLVLSLMFASALAGEWKTYLLWAHGGPFGVADPIFGRDLGFFVFSLPWQLALTNFLLGLLVAALLLTLGVYLGIQSMAALARVELGRPAIRGHLCVLIGATAVVYGVQMWLRRYQYGQIENGQFAGAGYAAMHQLPVQGILACIVIIVGFAGIFSAFYPLLLKASINAAVATAALYLLGLVVYPAIIQVAVVNPNKLATESPYALRAINMTRYAYGLDRIQAKQTVVSDEPSSAEVMKSKGTLDNMRLWDPAVLRSSIEALQGLKPYYSFNDVDIDRYRIGGRQQMVMISPRDLDTSGLSPSAQTWVNTRLQYTHGFGVTVSPVNSASGSGQPTFLVRDIPPVAPPELAVKEPRIYFSDYRNSAGEPTDNYVLVNTKVDEFDYPSQLNDQYTHWSGTGGINVGSLATRLAFSMVLGDINLLISTNVGSGSRLLLHRGVVDRAKLIYPFLSFDSDPYVVLLNGRMVWILDGYTSTDFVPYSAHTTVGDQSVNYLRNPVKVIVDAYSGQMDAFAIDASEPLLQTYQKMYPGLVHPADQIPAELRAHFRYPEDLFKVQAMQLTQYHVTNPNAFLNNEDAWDMPTERGLSGAEEQMRPYYVQMRLPEDTDDQFLLILPFTPRQKGNMSGWMAAHCDPAQYGKLRLYEYPRGSILPGPKQMEANFNQNPAIANLNTLLRNEQSRVIVGNLLVVPIGTSVMYVEPMFLESTSPGITPIPELKKVVIALRERVVVADTYAEALKQLFGNEAPSTSAAPSQPVAKPSPVQQVQAPGGAVSRAQVQEALRLAEQADAALRTGDFARYGQLQQALRAKLEQLSGTKRAH